MKISTKKTSPEELDDISAANEPANELTGEEKAYALLDEPARKYKDRDETISELIFADGLAIESLHKPKYYDTMFGATVRAAYDDGELTYDNIQEWDTLQNAGIPPKPAFNTKEILDYYRATGYKKDPRERENVHYYHFNGNATEDAAGTPLSEREIERIVDAINGERVIWTNAPKILDQYVDGFDYIIEMDNSNPTYISSLHDRLMKLTDELGIGFDYESNNNGVYGRTYTFYHFNDSEHSATEDTVKQGNSWVNKGKEGTHGKFRTKKEADAQRKAMFANGYTANEAEDDIDIELTETTAVLDKEKEDDYMVLVKESPDEGFLEYRFRDNYQAYGTFDQKAKQGLPVALLTKTDDGWQKLATSPQVAGLEEELDEQISLLVVE